MNLILIREEHQGDGVFGKLVDEKYNFICMTLERTFDGKPKVPPGVYDCVRGRHILPGSEEDFETFELLKVKNAWGILFHVGNYSQDSEGCILLGERIGYQLSGDKMLQASKQAFKNFMKLQDGVDEFQLKVEEEQ